MSAREPKLQIPLQDAIWVAVTGTITPDELEYAERYPEYRVAANGWVGMLCPNERAVEMGVLGSGMWRAVEFPFGVISVPEERLVALWDWVHAAPEGAVDGAQLYRLCQASLHVGMIVGHHLEVFGERLEDVMGHVEGVKEVTDNLAPLGRILDPS